MERHLICCSRETLVEFSDKKDFFMSFTADSNALKLQAYLSWYTLLSKEAELCIDINDDDYYELAERKDIIKFLEKSSQGGGSKIRLTPGMLKEDSLSGYCSEFPSSVFLTENLDDSLSSKYGRFFLSTSSMFDMGKLLFEDKKILIEKTGKNRNIRDGWNSIKGLAMPLTDTLLIDNYILSNERDGIWNIIELIRNIIPVNQKYSEIRVAIITALYNDTLSEIERKLDQWYEKLGNAFAKSMSGFQIQLSIGIINAIGMNHDRTLLTNYAWIDSGSGFKVFDSKNNPKATTTLKHSTILSQRSTFPGTASTHECWLSLRKHAKYLFQNSVRAKGDFNKNLLLRF